MFVCLYDCLLLIVLLPVSANQGFRPGQIKVIIIANSFTLL